MDLHLRGKRVLITGASKGIGAAAAEAFAEEGCHLRLAARSGDQLKALAERLRSAHQIDATTHVVDLRKPEDVARLVKETADIDILVNVAGINLRKRFVEYTEEDWDRLFAVNLRAAFLVAQAAARAMIPMLRNRLKHKPPSMPQFHTHS